MAAGLHEKGMDVSEELGRVVWALELGDEVPDNRVAQEVLGLGTGGGVPQ